MIVISDTSCINYLVIIDEINILYHLYKVVIIPQAVRTELLRAKTPEIVRDWVSDAPEWLRVETVELSSEFSDLGAGEREAIVLALQMNADVILIDDRLAREAAEQEGLEVTGTLGVLLAAAKANLLSLEDAIAKLKQTTYHASEPLYQSVLAEAKANETPQE